MVFQSPLAGIENTLWSGSYRLLRCQRGDEVAVPGHRHMMVRMHLSKEEVELTDKADRFGGERDGGRDCRYLRNWEKVTQVK